jgi:hypothetical protein
MNNHQHKFHILKGGLGVAFVLVGICLGCATPTLLIHADPRGFLLRTNDLPQDGEYYIPEHEQHPISNEMIVFLLGDKSGQERIERTGRVIGWRVHFVRGNEVGENPEDITQTIVQYASAQGAQLNLETYNMFGLYPQTGWQRMDNHLDMGDGTLIESRCEQQQDGSDRVSFSLSFAYRNMGVKIEAIGSNQTSLQEGVIPLAKIIFAKLEEAEPKMGPVPTPTPGFAPPEKDNLIYR